MACGGPRCGGQAGMGVSEPKMVLLPRVNHRPRERGAGGLSQGAEQGISISTRLDDISYAGPKIISFPVLLHPRDDCQRGSRRGNLADRKPDPQDGLSVDSVSGPDTKAPFADVEQQGSELFSVQKQGSFVQDPGLVGDDPAKVKSRKMPALFHPGCCPG